VGLLSPDDALKGIGRDTTNAQRLIEALKELQEISPGDDRPLIASRRKALQTEIDGLRRIQQGEVLAADAARQRQQATEAQGRIEKLRDETLSKQLRMERELTKYRADASLAGVDAEQRARDEAAIREKYADKGGSKSDRGLGRALLAEQLQDVRSAEQQKLTIYRQSEAIIEAQRQAGLLSEADYYDARRAFARLDADSRIGALQEEIETMQRVRGPAT
jgi:hypothetical protein